MFTARLRRWFTYDDWANREVVSGLRRAHSAPTRSIKLLSHIVGTEFVWYARLKGETSRSAVWPEWSLEQIAAEIETLKSAWSAYLEALSEEDLARETSYTNSRGEHHRSRVEDVLVHVVMHGAYHRGQIAADMRGAGQQPVDTDFIVPVRRGLI